MRVTAVTAYRQFQPFVEKSYGTSGGTVPGFDSVVVAVAADDGLVGWGEMAPLGSFYSDAFAAGARAGIAELAACLLGCDPTQSLTVMSRLDRAMRGQPYIKSALDMACWDLRAKAAGQPLYAACGGGFGDAVELFQAIPPDTSEAVATRAVALVDDGYRRLQIKVGGEPRTDYERLVAVRDAVGPAVELFADANGHWTTRQALKFLRLSRDLSITVEQPCATLAECAAVRNHCPHPMVLDESIDSLQALLTARAAGTVDGVTIKLSRVGGITPALLIRDVAVELNVAVTIEDTGGASIDTAAIVHVSMSTPERLRTHTSNFSAWVTNDNGVGLPAPVNGSLAPPKGTGLGIEVLVRELGEPFFTTAASVQSLR
jgi:L-alanine-DL-glutamate epimerase-like enolase superfamily enzyme